MGSPGRPVSGSGNQDTIALCSFHSELFDPDDTLCGWRTTQTDISNTAHTDQSIQVVVTVNRRFAAIPFDTAKPAVQIIHPTASRAAYAIFLSFRYHKHTNEFH